MASALTAALLAVSLPQGPSLAQQGESVGARVDRLEAQIADLKVMVGTLESLLRATPSATLRQQGAGAQAFAAQGDLGERVDALETQIGALTNQLEQVSRQMGALEAKLSAVPRPSAPVSPGSEPQGQQGQAPAMPSSSAAASAGDTSQPRWFGPRPDEGTAGSTPENGNQPESLMAALPNSDAQALYEQGYGELLQRDYAAAEAAFHQVVDRYPDDPLAGNARYWLGETYYVRRQYKKAADTFLKGYNRYKSGQKAPDMLLKLGMSLAALGQKDAACSTFGELDAKFPAAPVHIRDQAKGEGKKVGC